MRSFNIFSRVAFFFVLGILTSCSPFQEEKAVESVVEIEYSDSTLVQQSVLEVGHGTHGSMSFEVQKDLSGGATTLYAQALFHAPVSKNLLFADVSTSVLGRNVYKPKEEEEPCGIPGYPECPSSPTPTPAPSPSPTPDEEEPCGIPGFPDCSPTPTPTPAFN